MLEMIVTCAGCGKRFKGIPSAKKYKCSCCGNQFTFPDSTRSPSDGSVLCSCCWTGHEKSVDLEKCSSCGQEILFDDGGRAEWSTEAALMRPASVSGSMPGVSVGGSDEIIRENTDLKSRLLSLQETLAQVQQERDAASLAQQSYDERIIELKTRLQLSADAQRDAETRLVELQARHVAMQDNETNALREKDALLVARQALEMRVAELEGQLKAQKEIHDRYLKERDDANEGNRLSENRVIELLTRAELAQEAEKSATTQRDAALASQREIEFKLVTLEAKTAPLQGSIDSLRAERDEAVSKGQALEAKVTELQERTTAAQQAAAIARIERDNAVSGIEFERSGKLEAQKRLKQFQELANTALGPLGTEYGKVAQELTEQAQALFKLAAQTQEELDQRRSQLAMLERTLKHRLDSTCREFVEKLAKESTDEKADRSSLAPASAAESGPRDNVVIIPGPHKPATDSQMLPVPDSGEHASVAGQ